ncbi:MAG: hypothetical protein Q9166_005867 [cf. Caloplaca sp. 2 TL-2023]
MKKADCLAKFEQGQYNIDIFFRALNPFCNLIAQRAKDMKFLTKEYVTGARHPDMHAAAAKCAREFRTLKGKEKEWWNWWSSVPLEYLHNAEA